MTSDRPYRAAFDWSHAVDEIAVQSGRSSTRKSSSPSAARSKLRRIHGDLVASSTPEPLVAVVVVPDVRGLVHHLQHREAAAPLK